MSNLTLNINFMVQNSEVATLKSKRFRWIRRSIEHVPLWFGFSKNGSRRIYLLFRAYTDRTFVLLTLRTSDCCSYVLTKNYKISRTHAGRVLEVNAVFGNPKIISHKKNLGPPHTSCATLRRHAAVIQLVSPYNFPVVVFSVSVETC